MKKYLPFIFFGLFFGFFIVKILIENLILKSNYRYTVATIKKISAAVNGGPDADFEYKVYGKTYSSFIETKNFIGNVQAGDSFYIKFSVRSPSISEILVNMPVRCTVDQVPDSGWGSINSLPCQ